MFSLPPVFSLASLDCVSRPSVKARRLPQVEAFKVTFGPLTSCAVAVFGAPAPTTANAASATVATRMLFVLLMQIPPCPCSKALMQSYCDCSLGSAGAVRTALDTMGPHARLEIGKTLGRERWGNVVE